MSNIPVIRSEGDLEVVMLHETHSALAELIGPELYSIGGVAPEQSIIFHNRPCFNLFLVQLIEFVAEGQQSAYIDEKFKNLSLLSGLRWLCDKYPTESTECELEKHLQCLEIWIEKEVPINFWCPDVESEIEFPINNRDLISFGANTTKHNLLRLSKLIGRLEGFCKKSEYNFTPQELSAVLSSMIEEVNSRLQYHSTYLVELLGNLFYSLNTLIKERYNKNPTNKVNEMTMPEGITSDIFKDMYGSIMVFKCYDDNRITSYTPKTTRFLKLRY